VCILFAGVNTIKKEKNPTIHCNKLSAWWHSNGNGLLMLKY
jgi:hypothetical protein